MKKNTKVVLNILDAIDARLFYGIDQTPLYRDLDDVLDKVFRARGYSEQEIRAIRNEVLFFRRRTPIIRSA